MFPIEITNPLFVALLFVLIAIFIYCCCLLYFVLGVRVKKLRHDYFPSVSVLVYAKDAGNTIRRRIENLLKQNYPKGKYEIIVYDNASKDETGEICKSYRKRGLIRYIRTSKGYEMKGPFLDFVINKYAKGDILLMTDPDVISDRNWILRIVQPFKNKKVGAVGGTVHCGNYYKGFVPLMRAVEDEWRFVVPILRDSDTVFSVGANQALRREAWHQTRYGRALLDDLDIVTRIIDKGWKAIGVSATGVEEEVETLGQYWRQRTRWYKVNAADYLGEKRRCKKFFEGLPHVIQFAALIWLLSFIISLASGYLLWLCLIDFIFLNFVMVVGFFRIKTGKAFIPAIPLFLTIDAVLMGITLLYAQVIYRFINVTIEVWPSLKGRYYHAGSELRTWFFKFEQKVRNYTRKVEKTGKNLKKFKYHLFFFCL